MRTLIFAVSSLDLLVHALLHFALEDSRSRRLIVLSSFENMRRIDPVIYFVSVFVCEVFIVPGFPHQWRGQSCLLLTSSSAHNVHARPDIVFVDGHITVARAVYLIVQRHNCKCVVVLW